jgi:TPR repeat protein
VLIVAACAVLALAGPARADFAEGLAAYDGGDYYAAYLAWLPLAEAGDGDARAAIADLYLSELLNPPAGANERRRIQRTGAWWYRQAASCGHVVAQLNLGELYSNGVGVERDMVEAYVWLGLAAHGGNRWAADRQERIAKEMTRSQVDAAMTQLESWTTHPDCERD